MFYGFVITVEKNLSDIKIDFTKTKFLGNPQKINFWVMLMKIGASTGCHQMYERSFSFFGYQFPVCARCTGLGLGQLLGIIFSFLLLKYNILYFIPPAVFSFVILGIDGIGQFCKKWESTNIRRFITGLLCGFFVLILFFKIVFELTDMITK